jgi:hypothetical protein
VLSFRCESEPGHHSGFHLQSDAPLIDAVSEDQASYIVDYLQESGYIRQIGRPSKGRIICQLTPKAWEQRERNAIGGTPGKCFIAMSFHDSLKEAYDQGIFLAVKHDCKMDPIRIDRVHHNEKICDRIVAEIRTCQFLIADVTLQRTGVYFEAGFAMGLARPVI